jgi:hypothetical protein
MEGFKPVAQCRREKQLQLRQARQLQVKQVKQARQAKKLQVKQARQLQAKMGESIMVIGGYKCATTTLKRTFNSLKSHHLYPPMPDSVTTILFPFRDNSEVYPSAFFQNIVTPRYNYSIFHKERFVNPLDDPTMKKIVLGTPADNLFTFFKNNISMFENALHLNNITRIRSFNTTYGCSIDYLNPDIQTFNIVVNGVPRKLVAFDHRILFSKFEELKMAIFSTPRPDIKMNVQNVGSTKWYGPKYVEFMKVFKEKMQKKSRAVQMEEGGTYLS